MKIKFLFAWYDLWIGLYWDRKGRKLYFLPIPFFGLVFDFGQKNKIDTDLGKIYRHYKGGYYALICVAFLESDSTPMAVYQSTGRNPNVYVRPEAEFKSKFRMVE